MAAREFIPIRPAAGGLTHATTMEVSRRTVCGKKCDAWVIEPGKLTCNVCRDEIAAPLQARARAKKVTAGAGR